ncbi:MAG: UDP-N-acetylmuramoyl-L-alanyl-D-glutamate--2,6-diaminopimelate ligase [Chlorobiales bacterium]|jgi:UDP-N-acetylmuramoyl-L-alanyl-D-glutamate--2,6-diaminopimelate ligase|nr:UDP-N-acetylmuramoyl-L-alanyl-D-glutamate--2,6-diaminopimelate ligase [Chlorobiales bacterium]
MRLKTLVETITPLDVYGELCKDSEVAGLSYDSRKVVPSSVFVAIRGFKTDGHQFIGKAVASGAQAVICEDLPTELLPEVTYVKVSDSRQALAQLSKTFFGNPSDNLKVIGVTGTNGKTTTTTLIKSILENNGIKSGLIGTNGYEIGGEKIDAERTTPESLELHELFAKMLDAGCTVVVMEVSSHSLFLKRTYGIRFDVALFTNLSHDHLDFHETIEKYAEAKKILFDSLDKNATAIVNADDPYSELMVKDTAAKVIRCGVVEMSNKQAARISTDVVAKVFSYQISGTTAVIANGTETMMHRFQMLGRFNMYNIVMAFAVGSLFSIDRINIIRGIMKCATVRGRMEQIWSKDHRCAIVDYSHTPDALEKVISAIKQLKPEDGKIITVFGCGGDRDRQKRPLMGKIADEKSDVVIITSDNPRSEEPDKILDEIEVGMTRKKNFYRIPDRNDAIRKGVTLLNRGDVLLVAGKGHETYQETKGVRQHFDDREVIEIIFKEQEDIV